MSRMLIVALIGASLLLGCQTGAPKSKLLETDEDTITNMRGGYVPPAKSAGSSSPAKDPEPATDPASEPRRGKRKNTPASAPPPSEPDREEAAEITPERWAADIKRDVLHYAGPLDRDVLSGTVGQDGFLYLQLDAVQVIVSTRKYAGQEFRLEQAPIPSEVNRQYVAGKAFRVLTDVPEAIVHVVVTEADLPGDPRVWKVAAWADPAPPPPDSVEAIFAYGNNKLSRDLRLGLIGGSLSHPSNSEQTSVLPPTLRCLIIPAADATYFIVNERECPLFIQP